MYPAKTSGKIERNVFHTANMTCHIIMSVQMIFKAKPIDLTA